MDKQEFDEQNRQKKDLFKAGLESFETEMGIDPSLDIPDGTPSLEGKRLDVRDGLDFIAEDDLQRVSEKGHASLQNLANASLNLADRTVEKVTPAGASLDLADDVAQEEESRAEVTAAATLALMDSTVVDGVVVSQELSHLADQIQQGEPAAVHPLATLTDTDPAVWATTVEKQRQGREDVSALVDKGPKGGGGTFTAQQEGRSDKSSQYNGRV